MQNSSERREASIRGYAAETAMCIDLPLSAVQEQIEIELVGCSAATDLVLRRLLKTVQQHRGIVERFTQERQS